MSESRISFVEKDEIPGNMHECRPLFDDMYIFKVQSICK